MDQKKPEGQRSLREAAKQGKKPDPPALCGGKDEAEIVIVACGHKAVFEPGAEKFRKERRAQLVGNPCKECRMKAHEERCRREKAEAAERRKNKPPRQNWRAAATESIARLPHGSVYGPHRYDADRQEWTGTLTIPIQSGQTFERFIIPDCSDISVDARGVTFKATVSGIFRLHSVLDGMYREWWAKQIPSSPAIQEAPCES